MHRTIDSAGDRPRAQRLVVVVAAHNEADRIAATVTALRGTFPDAAVWVADDGSTDATASRAAGAGARVSALGRRAGKGAAMTTAVRAALAEAAEQAGVLASDALPEGTLVMVCDGDLGTSAARLAPLVDEVASGRADLSVAAFAQRMGGGFGLALGFARWAIEQRCGLSAQAPISGQRVLGPRAIGAVLPFARGYGMEIGMTIDAVRAGCRVRELELSLAHRTSGRTAAGFAHRARQLVDFVRVYRARR